MYKDGFALIILHWLICLETKSNVLIQLLFLFFRAFHIRVDWRLLTDVCVTVRYVDEYNVSSKSLNTEAEKKNKKQTTEMNNECKVNFLPKRPLNIYQTFSHNLFFIILSTYETLLSYDVK